MISNLREILYVSLEQFQDIRKELHPLWTVHHFRRTSGSNDTDDDSINLLPVMLLTQRISEEARHEIL